MDRDSRCKKLIHAALAQVRDLANSVGGHWLTATASQHDQAVALISHMPLLVSAALLRAVGDERDPEIRQLAMLLASSGFADTSRVGGGNPELGVAMASTNQGCGVARLGGLPLEPGAARRCRASAKLVSARVGTAPNADPAPGFFEGTGGGQLRKLSGCPRSALS